MDWRRLLTISCLLLLVLLPILLATDNVFISHEKRNLDQIEETKSHVDSQPIDRLQTSTVLDAPIRLTYSEGTFDGYNMYILGKWNATDGIIDCYLVITDMMGDALAEKYVGHNYNGWCAEFINSTTILLGTDSGAALWNYYDDSMVYLNISGHHEYSYNPLNNTFFTLNYYRIEIDGYLYQFDYIEEYNSTGDLVWTLDTRDFISNTQWCPYGDMWADARDITHSNTVFFDADKDIIYYNSRNTNTFYKIDHKTGSVLWGLGEYGNFSLFDINGNPKNGLFYHAHSVEKIDENKFILFDNDYHNQSSSLHKVSRMIEIETDTNTMTANVTWAWNGPLDYYSEWWGDADHLPNGNRLGVFGKEYHPYSDLSARLVEVDESGNIVWEMSFEKPDPLEFIVYRMERFRFTPTLLSPEDVYVATNQEVNLTWSALYNFRTNVAVNGAYLLYIDDTLYESGTITYDSFWRPSNISFDVGILPKGIHNLTLSVSDDGGHFTNSTVNVLVSDFFIKREGSTDIEYGSPGAAMTWNGVSNRTLSGNITLNGSLQSEFLWNGSEIIVLDSSSLSIGSHEVQIRFYFGLELVYNESFWIHVYAQAAPEFISTPGNVSSEWNSTTILSWEFFDYSHTNVHVYINDTFIYAASWVGGEHQVNWTVPFRPEGAYRVTIEIIDVFDLRSISVTILTILPPSPPIIEAWPKDMIITWGEPNTSFYWKVHGGSNWTVFRNGIEIYHGLIDNRNIEIRIENWQREGWRLGTYNVTFVAFDMSALASVSSWITVIYNPTDPFADAVVDSKSEWYINQDDALGAPDNLSATVYMGYSNGYLTLDMGKGEEIIDGNDFDFKVVASGGMFVVSISEDVNQDFFILGFGSGNSTYDLSSSGFSSVRYVQIRYYSGDSINIDAVVANNFKDQVPDTDPPEIQGLADFEIFRDATNIVLDWTVTDATPWGYTVFVDGQENLSAPWSGGDIVFTYSPESVGKHNITIVVVDLFGNKAADSVILIVKPVMNLFEIAALAAIPIFAGFALIVYMAKIRE
ncbi:MAG: hypothetical protein EAX87_00900 [Candidatus Thorarchaeota archaeon]|nr:hypothetical protein [Candidatus Thorarchaeota archaeon]